MAGTGIFQWFWGASEAPTAWHGGYPSADRAAELAAGQHPDGDYTVVLADRVAIDPSVFDARAILAELGSRNLTGWPDVVPAVRSFELTDLEAKLSDCLDRWLRKHHYDDTTALHEIRARDYFPAREIAR